MITVPSPLRPTPQDVNYLRYRSSFGRNTAWHKASKGGKLPVLKSMANVVTRQFDPAKDLDAAAAVLQKLGGTPKEVMGKLLNVGNSRGYTPLMLACRGGYTEVGGGCEDWGVKLKAKLIAIAGATCRSC